MDELTDQIFHIPAYIAGFTEFCGVPLHKGYPQLLCDKFNNIGFAHPGWTDHKYIVFDHTDPGSLLPGRFFCMFDPVKMGANLGSQNSLGLILPDNKPIQIGF